MRTLSTLDSGERKYIDTSRRAIRVEEQLTEVDNELLPGEPLKTKGATRTVKVPAFLALMLEEHFARLEELRGRLELGVLGPDDFVFVNTRGGLLHRGSFRLNH